MAQSERSIRLELDRSLKSEEQIFAEWEQRIERKRETVNRIKAQLYDLGKEAISDWRRAGFRTRLGQDRGQRQSSRADGADPCRP